MVGGRTLWNLGRTAANCRHWLLSPHALTCVWHSRCPLTCPLLGLLLPLSCCCLGRSLLSHLEQNISSWRRLSGQGHVHAHVHCGLHNRHCTLRKMAARRCGVIYYIEFEFTAFQCTSALRSPGVKTMAPSYHKVCSRQESEEKPHKSCIGAYLASPPLSLVLVALVCS